MTDASRPYLSAHDRTELPALTGVRALAAIWVVGWHASGLTGGPVFPFGHGYLGVDLFFILSGFIISFVYWDEFQIFSGRLYLRFIGLRLARLYPVHLTMLLFFSLMVALAVAIGSNIKTDWLGREIVAQLLLIHNWGMLDRIRLNQPSWSISAEFLAYLLFPLYVALYRRLRTAWSWMASIVVAVALYWYLLTFVIQSPPHDPGPASSIRVIGEFAMGVAVFRLWQSGKAAHLPWAILVPAMLVAIGVIVGAVPRHHPLDYVVILLLAPTILGLAHGAGAVSRFLAGRPMVYLGETSYSTYMIHALVIYVVEKSVERLPFLQPIPGWIFFVAAIVFSLLAGALLCHVVEKPARRWLRQRIDSRLPQSFEQRHAR